MNWADQHPLATNLFIGALTLAGMTWLFFA